MEFLYIRESYPRALFFFIKGVAVMLQKGSGNTIKVFVATFLDKFSFDKGIIPPL